MNFIRACIQRFRTSLVYKYVLVFVAGALIPVIMLGSWSFWMSHKALNMHITDSVYQVLKEKIDYSTLLLQEIESLIANISGVEDITNTLKEEQPEQSDFEKLRLQAKIGYILSGYINIKGLESIDIFSANGRQYHVGESLLQKAGSNYPMVEALIRENREAQSSIVWHGIRPNPNNPSQYSLIASKRLLAFDPETMLERYVGIILVKYSVEQFSHKFIQNLQPGVEYIILDANENCIYSANPANIGKKYFSKNKLSFPGKQDNFVYARHNGKKVYLLQFTGEMNDWRYYTLLHKEYLNKISSSFTVGTMVILLMIMVISIVINVAYFRYLLQPIQSITNALQSISANTYDLSEKLPNPHQDEIGELIRWFNSFTDNLIEKESFQKELQVQKELAELANEAKGVFLANISHELRTPLNGVISVAELLETTPLNPEQREYLRTILQSGDILYSLINQVLDYSKIASNKVVLVPLTFDLVAFCDKLAGIYKHQARIKNIEFVYEKPAISSLYVCADDIALQKIIINLLGNSLKFTGRGQIHFRLGIEMINPDLADVMISIGDTGIGIAPDKQQSIFHAFEQADNALAKNYEGTGLGLAIAQQLANLMNSQILIQSPNPYAPSGFGPGSVFWLNLSLPTAPAPKQESRTPEEKFDAMPFKKCHRALRSLIVEDNPINQKVLSSILNKYGFTVSLASDWKQCLDILDKQSFDYIFMDIQMPGKTGLELTRMIRDKNIHTIIIAITGNALKEIEDQAYASGMNAFLVKPIRVNKLEEILLQFLPEECRDQG